MKLTAKQLQAYHSDPVKLISEQLFLEDDRPFGEAMAPFQRDFFEAVFASHEDGRPLHRLIYDERRRGESKTADSAAAALADLLVGPPSHRSYAVAGDVDQAELILESVRGFQARSPMLAEIAIHKTTVTNKVTGGQLRVMSSDSPTSYGIRPRRVYFDELSLQPDERLWTSMWSAVGKSPRSQMVTVSMAGWDFGSLGWRIRELAAKNPRYYFHSREGSELAPWLSAEDMEEQARTLHPADFSRFWECRWVEPAGSWITREMYDDADTGTEAVRAAVGQVSAGFVDVGLVHDATAVCVAHRDGERVVVDSIKTIQGSRSEPVELEALEDLVTELTQRFNIRQWRFEAPQAVATVQRLQRRLTGVQVDVRYPTSQTQAQLFGGLYALLNERRLVLYPHDQLRKEALNLVTRIRSGRLVVVESTSIHQDHVIALGGVCELLQSQPAMQPGDVQRFRNLLTELGTPGGSKTGYRDATRVPGVADYGIDRTSRGW